VLSAQDRSTTQNQSTAITTVSAPKSFFLAMNVIPTNRLVPVGGIANFTVVLYNGGDLTGNYSLSAIAPLGLSFQSGPSPIAISGVGPHAGRMTVRSSGEVSQGAYNVTILATGPKGVANQTFDFHLQRNLVLLTGISVQSYFSKMTVKTGDSITWESLDGPMSDEENAFHHINLSNDLLKINTTSGDLHQYGSWSYAFKQPGTYKWYDWSVPTITGEVIVTTP
jgi:hypothetical protein